MNDHSEQEPTGPGRAASPSGLDFASLLAPLTVDEFFRDYHGRKPLHVPGPPEKFRQVMNWEVLNRLLNMASIWSSESLQLLADGERMKAETYCVSRTGRDMVPTMQPDPDRVQQILGGGASLVAHGVDNLTPELTAIAQALEDALYALAECNLYYSSRERQALTSHYDPHDVFALHCHGEKVWHLYSRAANPVDHPSFTGLPKKVHEKNRGEMAMEVTMTPGDLLYLPRGQYHDALARTESSLHLTYGVVKVTGIDLMQGLTEMAIHDEAFRDDLPLPSHGREALHAHVVRLLRRLADLENQPKVIDDIVHLQKHRRYPRGGVELPVTLRETEYRRTDSSVRVVKRQGSSELKWSNGVAAIPEESATLIAWIVGRDRFSQRALRNAFPRKSAGELDLLLDDLQHMGVVRKVSDG